jgi:hypothetical protein
MIDRRSLLEAARRMRHDPFDWEALPEMLSLEVSCWDMSLKARRAVLAASIGLVEASPGDQRMSVQQWWNDMETRSPAPMAVRPLVVGRLVQPSGMFMSRVLVEPWVRVLPAADPLTVGRARLREACERVSWAAPKGRRRGICTGMRLMLAHDYDRLDQLTNTDLEAMPPGANGLDILDAALCDLGVFRRSPRRGTVRRKAQPPRSIDELVAVRIPEKFRPVTAQYMTAYSQRVSNNYSTVRTKIRSLAYFWEYLDERHPDVTECRQILPHQARGFVAWATAKARTVQRSTNRKGTEDRTTTYDWMVDVRTFFTDLCTWGTEPGSPLAQHMPVAIPLTSHDLNSGGFAAARARTAARMTATVMDLTREIPNIRAFALRAWHEAAQQLANQPHDVTAIRGERDRFWDWALLELLLTSGLRVEEVSELTTLDVLKRRLPDGQIYYLLHVKPSKYDRARVIPIGDGLGRVIAEIIGHIKAFYRTGVVPACDRRDYVAKTPLPTAPYLLQGAGHPSAMSIQTIRGGCRTCPSPRAPVTQTAPRCGWGRTTVGGCSPPNTSTRTPPST